MIIGARDTVRWFSSKAGRKLPAGVQYTAAHEVNKDSSVKDTGAVALLFGWLGASPRHLSKFGNLYHQAGVSSLTVQAGIGHVLQPDTATEFSRDILLWLNDSAHRDAPVIVHAFSVGGFLYAQMLHAAEKHNNLFDTKRIAGVVLDSPVDFEGVPKGIPRAMTDNAMAQSIMEAGIRATLAMRPDTTKIHKTASDRFKRNPIAAPSLWFYSSADKISDAETCRVIVDDWTAKGHAVEAHHLHSDHVQHYLKHPKLYQERLHANINDWLTK